MIHVGLGHFGTKRSGDRHSLSCCKWPKAIQLHLTSRRIRVYCRMLPVSTSRTTKAPKRTYICVLLPVGGGGDAQQAEFALLTIDLKFADTFLKRCAVASTLRILDESVGHVSFKEDYCDWLSWSERLEELLAGKEFVVLNRRPHGKSVSMDSGSTEVWHDGDTYFNASEKHSDRTLQAGPLSRQVLEEIKSRLTSAK
jgi:hypothetical protein